MTCLNQRLSRGDSNYRSGYTGKRLLDLSIALPAALIASPLIGLSALMIILESPGSPLFAQTRAGLHAKPFTVYKLRTMVVDNTHVGEVKGQVAGVTRCGSLLRRAKIDELPQLWNVIAGDMSMVGPRPCLMETAQSADVDGRMRFRVRPGLTGLAQINGNTDLTWQERWRFDREYVEENSLALDLGILWETVRVILVGDGLAHVRRG